MKTIFWDIDDVLCPLMKGYIDWTDEYRPTKYEDITENPPHEILGLTKESYLEALDWYREKYYLSLEPDDFILRWFIDNGNKFRHSVLTSVPLKYAPVSSTWVFAYFGWWIRSFNFIPSKRYEELLIPKEYDKSKAEFIHRLGNVDYFIDDNEENVQAVADLGIESFCCKQPWNDGVEISEILDIILSKE